MSHSHEDPGTTDSEKTTRHTPSLPTNVDAERQQSQERVEQKKSAYAGLGWLDRLLVLWILLAIIVGILLGNFVGGAGPALQKGKFVHVSVPIGKTGQAILSIRP